MAWPLTGRDFEDGQIRAALDDPARRPLALFGAPGVGTSRLLECVVEHGRARSWHVCAGAATAALQSVPFGAVAPFAANGGDLDTADRLGVIAALERDLLDAAGGADLVMMVDDAHWIDEASVALLERLRNHRRARIVVAVSDLSPGRVGGWSLTTTNTEIIEVLPLGRAPHDRLVDAVQPRPATRETKQLLWEHTGGRPRDLELLLDAIERAGVIDPLADVWQWDGEPVDSPGLRALVADELSGLGEAVRRAFEVVALGDPLPEVVADAILDDDARETLERAGLIGLRGSGSAVGLGAARPLVGVCVAARLGPTARRRILESMVGVAPAPGSSWALRHAGWATEAGISFVVEDPKTLARSALAKSDLSLAEELARRATDAHGEDVEARLLLAECLRRGRRGDDALRELEVAAQCATTDERRADVAILRSQIATLLQGDPASALRHLDDATAVVTERDARRRISSERDLARSFTDPVGTDHDPMSSAAPVLAEAAREELMVVALLRCLHLDLDGIGEVLGRLRASVEGGEVDPFDRARLAVCEHLARVGRGMVGEAHVAARAGLDGATERSEPLGMWALCVTFSGPLTGDLDGAAIAAFDADRSLRYVDPFGLRPIAAAVGATAAWQAGRPDMAATLASIAERPTGGADPRVGEIAAGRRQAWEMVLAGDVRGGAAAAASAGRMAIDAGHRLWGVIGLHEAVRLGAPALVLDDLTAVADATDSGLVRVFTAHAAALAAGRAAHLDEVAADLSQLGCALLAAEASAQAADLGDDEAARLRSAARAEIWWGRCSGRLPPALASVPRALTERQHEIAALATLGLSSQEIADRLVVARRTVDNHLRSVYRRLGVGGRDELASVLASTVG